MSTSAERKALSVEFYQMTGEAVSESDPIITGALFFSYKLLEAGKLAEQQIRDAGAAAELGIQEATRLAAEELREAGRLSTASTAQAIAKVEAATRSSTAAVDQMAVERAQTLKAVEAHVVKCVKQASSRQAPSSPLRLVPIWYCFVAAAVGAAMSLAWAVGVERGSVQADEAAIGRSFSRAIPGMKPKLRQQIMEHLRRNQD